MSSLWLWLAGTFGLGAVILGFWLWRFFSDQAKEANESGVLRYANQAQSQLLQDVGQAAEARDRLHDDPAFAKFVRDKYTRTDE